MPEHQEIEWKESWRDEYLKWLCGYANAHGGTLFIGIDDNGKVVGVEGSKKLLEDLPNKITMHSAAPGGRCCGLRTAARRWQNGRLAAKTAA